jgi:hypothetical protein
MIASQSLKNLLVEFPLQNRTFVKFKGGLLEDLDIRDARSSFLADGKLSNR